MGLVKKVGETRAEHLAAATEQPGRSASELMHMAKIDPFDVGSAHVGLCERRADASFLAREWSKVTCVECLQRKIMESASPEASPGPLYRTNCSESEARISGIQVLTVPEVARLLSCSKNHVLNAVHGKIPGLAPLPHVDLGRRILIRPSSLATWLSEVESRHKEASKW